MRVSNAGKLRLLYEKFCCYDEFIVRNKLCEKKKKKELKKSITK